jgi:hypothetical protein
MCRISLEKLDIPIMEQGEAFGFGIHYNQPSFPLCQLQSRQWHPMNNAVHYERRYGTVYATQFLVSYCYDLCVLQQSPQLADVDVTDVLQNVQVT